ncbi:MAG: DUF5677 domain-containing protein [Candidatus Nitrotoga sp.]|nr:DUF5677 domain-containing protein [Candidatus Nitrotoga sp.]
MPEMLWAVLLSGVMERRDYLDCYRRIAILCREWFVRDERESETPDPEVGLNFTVIIDHTKLAEISNEQFQQFVAIPLKHPLGYAALRPLLLIESLPGRERWIRALAVSPSDEDWQILSIAVAGTFDHQSERSTDIRWFKLILPIISGRMFFPESMAEQLEELRLFPDKGDMRRVRPFIRSGEMTLRRNPTLPWVAAFWAELLEKTRCIDPAEDDEYTFVETELDPDSLHLARDHVIQRFRENLTAKRADARLDSAFGLVLYALSVIEEIGLHRVHMRILGRIALRSLVETNITFRYLAHKDDPELWKSYRVYGAGQAKLAFLKAQELEGDLPQFIDEGALHQIANEDIWQEFLGIDVGHWSNSNLRKLATEADAKNIYDKYYDWASAFVHGHWAAVRDTNFVTCHNPLHRLHRIPRHLHRILNSVEQDAVGLVNEMLSLLDVLYPGVKPLEKISLSQNKPKRNQ